MSNQESTNTYDSDESQDSDAIRAEEKALPWHSMDLVKREEALSENAEPKHPSALDFDKLKISPDDKDILRSSSPELEIHKNALPWDDKCEDIQMKDPPSEINILLLGESGVGKSTFINSFANYMKHDNFEAVQQSSLSVLIPSRFHIFDKCFKKHEIEIGAKDKNEYLADGAAATQDVKTYVFYITLENKSYMIRLIDTPGMGDPRGIKQDNKNCEYVLSYLGRVETIHAICVLLKPTNTRLDIFLNYCVTQILSRLEKSAIDNIAFLFTNTRGQNYTPGETYISLELLVKKIKESNNVSLPLSHENVFCFDNEAFRFLAAVKQKVEFRDGILEANIESWKYSYKEVYRFLSYVVELKPHDPKKTISINHARKMVMQLSQPIAEIVQLIGDNIYELDQHTHQLLMENQTLDDLKQKLYMPVIDIIVKELKQPVTVCTASQCSTIYKVADKNKFHYNQRCHNPCFLNDVPAELVGDPHLLDCWAMNKATQSCHQCGCRFNTHMHIYYETDTFETKIVDRNVQQNITSKEDATSEKQVIIDQILNHKEQLEKEHKYIIKCSAEFAHFLKQNAITPINDSMSDYVKYLITREENLGAEANKATLDYLRRLLLEYEQERNVLVEALKVDSSPTMIKTKIRDLFTLPNFGKKIRELYDLNESGGMREHKQSEHVVKERYVLSIVDKVKTYKDAILGAFSFRKPKKQHAIDFQHQRALAYEQSHYHKQLQNQEGHLNGNFYYNGSYGNFDYVGPSVSQQRSAHWQSMYGWADENSFPPSERQVHPLYALEYDKMNENRQRAFNLRKQYSENIYSHNNNANMGNGAAFDPRNHVSAYIERDERRENLQATLCSVTPGLNDGGDNKETQIDKKIRGKKSKNKNKNKEK